MVFEVFRYERGGDGKVSLGKVIADDVDSAEVAGFALIGKEARQRVKKSFRRQSGSMFAWDDEFQYGAVFFGDAPDQPL